MLTTISYKTVNKYNWPNQFNLGFELGLFNVLMFSNSGSIMITLVG